MGRRAGALLLSAIVAACGACGSGKGDHAASSPPASGPPAAPSPPAAPRSGLDLFAGAKVTLPAVLGPVTLGTPAGDAAKQLAWPLDAFGDLPGFDHVKLLLRTGPDAAAVEEVTIQLGGTNLDVVRAKVESLWGPARVVLAYDVQHLVWDDLAGGVRMSAIDVPENKRVEVSFSRIVKLDTLLGADGKLGLEHDAPLLGADKPHVRALPGAWEDKDGKLAITLPATEASIRPSMITLDFEHGVVSRWSLALHSEALPMQARVDAVTSALTARFGAPKKAYKALTFTKDGAEAELTLPDSQDDYDTMGLLIEVRARTK